jgi:thiosulfate dehydrogenase [quinone] large subunit
MTKLLTKGQLTAIVVLRILIGWHFLYEGIAKLLNPYWTSAGFLMDSQGIFSGFFKALASNPTILKVVDFMNIWGLIAIGVGLILGILTRAATISGVVLLALYYLCNPPFIGYTYSLPAEGSYLLVNKVLIELAALAVLVFFPSGKAVGLDRLIWGGKRQDPVKLKGGTHE